MNCQQATNKLESLQLLRTQLGEVILAFKESQASGDTAKTEELKTKARAIKQELETGIKEMNREIFTFVVPNAINPYAKGLTEAGLSADHPECAEKKEIIVDIKEVIQEHIEFYKDQNMPEWAEDIEKNKKLLLDILSDEKEQEKMEKRIEEGMIPIVMPGRGTQQRTWRDALNNLKPICINNGEEENINQPFFVFEEKYNERMSLPSFSSVGTAKGTIQQSFFDSIPECPYFVWIKPIITAEKTNSEWNTTDLSFEGQQAKLRQLHKDHPDLADEKDIVPTEYVALQFRYTKEIQKQADVYLKRTNTLAKTIMPLDSIMYTRFLCGGVFYEDNAPYARFDFIDGIICFGADSINNTSSTIGFRPVARS